MSSDIFHSINVNHLLKNQMLSTIIDYQFCNELSMEYQLDVQFSVLKSEHGLWAVTIALHFDGDRGNFLYSRIANLSIP